MRIVYLAWQGSVHTRTWAGFFAARGHDVHVVTCGDADVGDVAYTVHELGPPRPAKVGYVSRIPAARRLVRRLAPDIVHAHFATSYGMLGLASGVRPFVVTAHGSDVLIGSRSRLIRPVLQRVLRAADLVTVPAEHMAEAVRTIAGAGVPVDVLQYGVECERLEALGDRLRATAEREDGVRHVVSARPLEPLYNLDLVVDAIALLRERGEPVVLDVAGAGSQETALRQRAAERGVSEAVRFHGFLPLPEVEALIARADCYVSVARSDGTSIALLETLAIGTVPVLSDIPANRPWVEPGASGVLVAPEPAAVADGIRAALALEPGTAREINRARVRTRADRETNLGGLERRMAELLPRVPTHR